MSQELTTLWTEAVAEALRKTKDRPLDINAWNPDKILHALTNQNDLKKFFSDKFSHRPTEHNIPPAIYLKFKHRDTAFFRSFTKDRRSKPAHQIEYEECFNKALNNYKRMHKVSMTNKKNRDQIYMMLKKKLAANYITNLNFITLNAHQTTIMIYYCAKFAQIENIIPFETMRMLLGEAASKDLEPLPDSPDLIPEDITEFLPFALPISDRKQTRAVVAALRKIFSFTQLPSSYFYDNKEPLPIDPDDLIDEFKGQFPITDYDTLSRLSEIRASLKKHYHFTRIPSAYFDLPVPEMKDPLPLTPQELPLNLR